MGSRVAAMLVGDEHSEAIAAFNREVWDRTATRESVLAARRKSAAENVAHPGVPTPAAIVIKGDRVIGFCGTLAQRLWDGKTPWPAYWVKGLMVLPEFRGGPVGLMVMRELASHLDLSTIVTVAPAARRLFAAVGYADIGAIPNWVRPLRVGRMLSRLDLNALGTDVLPSPASAAVRFAQRTGVAAAVGGVVGVAVRVLAATTRAGASLQVSVARAEPASDEIDALWSRSRRDLAASPVRDQLYLLGRFSGEAQSNVYMFVEARKAGRLVGLAVVRRPKESSDPRLSGLRVATLSDIVYPIDQPATGAALLGGVEHAALDAGGDAILSTTAHPALIALLRRQAYFPASANIHFFVRDRHSIGSWPKSLASWWLTRGDGESDEVF
jgi:hypothetical protein